MPPSQNQELGQFGEQTAAEFLITKGFILLQKNLRTNFGEIDLLMKDGEEIVLVEVKTRKSATIDPSLAVQGRKYATLHRLAHYVATKYPERNIRIDLVTLYWNPKKELIIDYFPNI